MSSKATDGAKASKGVRIKPVDNKKRGTCPCNAFLRCSTRRPYGCDVWGNPKKCREAMGEIAYSGDGAVENKNELSDRFQQLLSRQEASAENTVKRYNKFYKNLVALVSGKISRVLTMPRLEPGYMEACMSAVTVNNKASFSDFQRSVAARANLVRNGLVMRSDIYVDSKGREVFSSEKVVPYSGSYTPGQWTVDHVQVKSKGGCNRFCNMAILSRQQNCQVKNDDGPGCPCVDPKKRGESLVADQLAFNYPQALDDHFAFGGDTKKKPDYKLYECSTLWINKKNEADKLPDSPPATIQLYPKICQQDDPRRCLSNAQKRVEGEVEKICK